jgi:hypothetical protein
VKTDIEKLQHDFLVGLLSTAIQLEAAALRARQRFVAQVVDLGWVVIGDRLVSPETQTRPESQQKQFEIVGFAKTGIEL